VVELLSKHVARHIHAYSGTGFVVTLDTSAVAACGGEGRLTGGSHGCRDVEAVAACCCCADALAVRRATREMVESIIAVDERCFRFVGGSELKCESVGRVGS
jgi:hypothetical protein